MRIPIISLIQRLRSTSAHLVRRRVQCLVGFYFSAVHALILSEIVAARSMRFLLSCGRSIDRADTHYFFNPTSAVTGGALCAPYGATPCSDLCFGCSAVPFLAPDCLFLRRIRPHQRPGGSDNLLIRTSRVRGPDTLWRVPCTRLFDLIFISLEISIGV